MPTDGPTPEDHRLAARAATTAGARLLEVREELRGAPGYHVGDEGDRQAHDLLVELIEKAAPGDAILSEEGRDDLRRLEERRVWIIDPLDGTREFGEVGRSDWAVHVALAIDGEVQAGAVALPALGTTLASDPAPVVPDRAPGRIRIVVSRSRPPAEAHVLARELDGELVALGSAGAKAMAVVLGHVDVYAHSGGQYEWDNAAPAVVAQAAGLHASRLDGSPLRYNSRDPWLPDLLICRPELADDVLGALGARR
ncbi:MAG TPA: 3'(2'),5'-bisphosphate nucleotidase CysQ [Acidimicrobiales bacterium]|nr:3'(2'),5'-bisphosphate nucleotidase CysQ [Acidimicrobiales bacterium]